MSSVDERLALLKGFVLKNVTGRDITKDYESYVTEILRSQDRVLYGMSESAALPAKRTRKSKRKESSSKQKRRRRSSRTRRRSR
jgi:hypothetical protein